MTTIDTRRHVAGFLLPLDAPSRFMRGAQNLVDCADRDAEASAVLSAIKAWVDQAEIDIGQRAESRRLRGQRSPAIMDESPEATTLLAVAYLRTTELLRGMTERLDFPKASGRAFRRVPRLLATIERDFLGELLVETELRAARDRAFADELQGAVGELRLLAPELDELARRLPFPGAPEPRTSKIVLKKPPDLEENFAFYVIVGVVILVAAVAGKAIEAED